MTGSDLNRLREKCNLSIEKMSRLIKRSEETIRFWESMESDIPTMIEIFIVRYFAKHFSKKNELRE